ncbi:MarR family winged helix-turn-helix transcriptional regulator [Xanthobacter agilis]|uniref:DNA-binding MarR family transcriptional regulator n=1 Tax=Xanthobacter agilis TaxID=47492 RepID=A0ABU0LCU4_XANAG|nr:hypothetical protein [Xanthobacter agilis]MDQ0504946.1 DNA-binding MarR family transcriptional regulator [Xanthobacter agilis]
MRQGVNADELGLEGPSPVRIVDMLLAEGLVSRLEDPDDQRAKLLCLTPSGRAPVAEVEAAIATLRARFLNDVSDEDLAVIVRGLARVEAALVSELSA